jgi:D-arabinose 5-phosphate isomerase GutQ
VILFISFSGRTSELLNILPHISKDRQILAITSHPKQEDCPLLKDFENGILLPAPIHEPEETSFGVCAPTTSTTVAMAIGDMIALTVAEKLHDGMTSQVFKKNHPGGAIGAAVLAEEISKEVQNMVTPLELPSPSISARSD